MPDLKYYVHRLKRFFHSFRLSCLLYILSNTIHYFAGLWKFFLISPAIVSSNTSNAFSDHPQKPPTLPMDIVPFLCGFQCRAPFLHKRIQSHISVGFFLHFHLKPARKLPLHHPKIAISAAAFPITLSAITRAQRHVFLFEVLSSAV